MFCCTLLYVHSSIAIILMGKRELIALLNLSSWCLVMVERLFLAVPQGCLQFVIMVFPDHTHLLFLSLMLCTKSIYCDMSQVIVLLAFGNVSDLKKVTDVYHFCYNLQLNLMLYYIKVAFQICILQCATRSNVQILALYTMNKILLVVVKNKSIFYLINIDPIENKTSYRF